MAWPLMMFCCVSFALTPHSLALSLFDIDPVWREEPRAVLEPSSRLQPSGPGHGLPTDLKYYETPETDEYDIIQANKRALSALSRWKPFSSAWGIRGVRPPSRAPLVSALLPPSGDVSLLSAEPRAMSRPPGQPLRWGKRRR